MSETTARSIDRRHDLDALRAVAMLLGIGLHGVLSFVPFPWPVQDSHQNESFTLFFFAVHGFRMPLFFLISGFFTAMLWRKRGLGSLISHRFRRIFLPCMLGLVTVVPLVNWVSGVAMSSGNTGMPTGTDGAWAAAATGDIETLTDFEGDLNAVDKVSGQTLLSLAALVGQADSVAILIDRGADVNTPNAEGGTALHNAAFLGRAKIAERLIDAGAITDFANIRGETPLDSLRANWQITEMVADYIRVDIDRDAVESGRSEIASMIQGDALLNEENETEQKIERAVEAAIVMAFIMPFFHHLWFLWFLCWLVVGFVFYALFADWLEIKSAPRWLIASPIRYLWLIPITMLPQAVMGMGQAMFGPDTSAGVLPMPHVLFYYAIFFGFGVLYFDCHDDRVRVGKYWPITLLVSLAVVLPLGLEFSMGTFGFGKGLVDPAWHRTLSVFLQVTYAWMMSFACMGLFQRFVRRENKTIRYLSDSSYWLYVAHLPLIIGIQLLVKDWPLPASVKLLLVCATTSAILLLSYQTCVRYTPIGWMLNGRRERPSQKPAGEEPILAELVTD